MLLFTSQAKVSGQTSSATLITRKSREQRTWTHTWTRGQMPTGAVNLLLWAGCHIALKMLHSG